jgi:hypothetical protein
MIGLSKVLPHFSVASFPVMETTHAEAGHGISQWEHGVEEGKRQAEAAHALAVSALIKGHREELVRAREEWCGIEGAELAKILKTQVATAGDAIANAVAKILESVIAVELPKTAMKSMQAEIRAAFKADGTRALKLTGQPDLIAALSKGLSAEGIQITETIDADGSIEASAGDLLTVTMLDHWLRELRGG